MVVTFGGILYAVIIGIAITQKVYAAAAALAFYGLMLGIAEILKVLEK